MKRISYKTWKEFLAEVDVSHLRFVEIHPATLMHTIHTEKVDYYFALVNITGDEKFKYQIIDDDYIPEINVAGMFEIDEGWTDVKAIVWYPEPIAVDTSDFYGIVVLHKEKGKDSDYMSPLDGRIFASITEAEKYVMEKYL